MQIRLHSEKPNIDIVAVEPGDEERLYAHFAYGPLRHTANILGMRDPYQPNAQRHELGSEAPVRLFETDVKHKKLFKISARLGRFALKHDNAIAGNMFVQINHYLEGELYVQMANPSEPLGQP